MSQNLTTLDIVMHGLMHRYSERVPDVTRVTECMIAEGLVASASEIENDHVAFRTMGVPQLGIQSFEKIFLSCGYQRRDNYHFAGKKLNAYWYAPPKPNYPRIFVSELLVDQLSKESSEIIKSYTDEVAADPVEQLDLNDGKAIDEFLHRPLWRLPTLSDYRHLANESEYAAWVIYNRYYLNHYTVSVHNLPEPYCSIERFDEFLERNNFKLNDAGGKIKVSGDGLLRQSSTVAEMIDAEFDDGEGGTVVEKISGSYVEFAERRPLDEFVDLPKDQLKREHLRDGFETANADKIFESTYSSQTDR